MMKHISGAVIFDYRVNTKKQINENQIDKLDWKLQGKPQRTIANLDGSNRFRNSHLDGVHYAE